MVDNVDEQMDREPTQFQKGQFYPCGHNDNNMPGINGVVFNAFEDSKVFQFLVAVAFMFFS